MQVLGRWGRATGLIDPPISLFQLLFQESNPGVHYKYTIHRDSHDEVQLPEFSWHYGPWSKCTVTCGTGETHT